MLEGVQTAGVEGGEGRPTIVRLTAASSARRLHASEHLDYLGTLLGYTHTSTHIHLHIYTYSLSLACQYIVLPFSFIRAKTPSGVEHVPV